MKSIGVIIVSVLLNSAAQLAIKKGMSSVGRVSLTLRGVVDAAQVMATTWWLWAGMLCFVLSVLLWMFVLSRVDVSFAYPFNSIGYVLVTLFGYLLFGEPIGALKALGIGVICIGVVLVALV
jgi:multidrug transporter EmrE-like cation transporter